MRPLKWLSARFAPPAPVAVREWSGLNDAPGRIGDAPRILVLKLDHIGDLITALPAFQILRSAWPAAEMVLVCGPDNISIATALGIFDRIVPFRFFPPSAELKPEPPDFSNHYEEFSQLELGLFDIAIDLRHDDDTRPLLFRVEAKYRVGYASKSLKLPPLDIGLPEIETSVRANSSLFPVRADTRLSLLVSLVTLTLKTTPAVFADKLTQVNGVSPIVTDKYVVVAIGAGSPTRQWRVERMKDFCARLCSQTAHRVVLVGGPADAAEAAIIVDGLPQSTVINLVGRLPLQNLPSIIGKASLFIGYDTGPTHIAGYLGVPTLGIYSGAGDPNVWVPGGPNVMVLRADVSCSPCYLRQLSECRHGHVCMESITAERTFDAAIKILMGGPGAAHRAGRRDAADIHSS